MRSANSFKNLFVSVVAQIITLLVSFVSRTIFVKVLTTEYLGLSGLFSNILSVLSLSELGIGNAIIINLYKPLAEKDEIAVSKYMNFYAKAYRLIGILILIFGFISTPFLQYIVKTDDSIPNLRLIYFLFVLNSAVSYFFASKRTIFTVDQKEYVNTINRNMFLLVQNLIQIIVLMLTQSYIMYICIMVLCTFSSNLHISILADKQYPYLRNKQVALNKIEIKDLTKSMKAIMLHKVGNVLINSTDNLIISMMLGVYWVGMYSNYSMVVGMVTTFALIVFAACSASIGNINAVESSEKVYSVFRTMTFLSLWIYGFCSISFVCLFQPFITVWIGNDYLLDMTTVIVIVIAFFLKGIIGVTSTFLDVTKLFLNTRWVPLLTATINLAVSVLAVAYFGLAGVFGGTIVSYLLTMVWINPFMLYKSGFNKKFREYIGFIVPRIILIFIAGFITYFLTIHVDYFVVQILICIVVPNMIMLITWGNTSEFKYISNIIRNLLGHKH